MENKLICDFCRKNDSVGVYATDHGPFSLSYCDECLKHKNIRTLGNALSKWARFGEKAFDEYKSDEWSGCEPNVFFKDKYISLRELVKIITIDDVEEYFKTKTHLVELIISKLKERM